MEPAILFDKLRKNSSLAAAYTATLYFFEILFIMFSLMLMFGKQISVIAGLILSVTLTAHIIMLYLKKNINRKIHLFLIDIHIATTVPFFLKLFFPGIEMNMPTVALLAYNIIMLLIEIPMLFLLTDEGAIREYS